VNSAHKGLPVETKMALEMGGHGTALVGPYWGRGMKKGYQSVGALDFMNSTPDDRRLRHGLYVSSQTSKTFS